MSHTNSTPNYSLPQFLSSDKPAWMADINAAMSAIDTGMKANADAATAAQSTADKAVLNGAPGYSNLSTYDVDDVVNYQGRVYKCIIAVTTPEAFDNAKWILYDLQDASKAIDDIDLEIGSADISGIGDGSVKGAISEINSNLSEKVDKAKFDSNTLSYEPEWDGVESNLNQFFRLDASTVLLIQCNPTFGISFRISSDNMQTWTTLWTK